MRVPSRIVAAVVLTALALLAAVVTVGLITRTLDTTNTALALSTMASGVVIAALTRRGGDDR